MEQHHTVTFLPENKTVRVRHLTTIFETIVGNNPDNIELRFACGAEGICRKCKIRSFQHMGPLTPTEKGCLTEQELARGVRLACQARVVQDMHAEILYKTPFTLSLSEEPVSAGSLHIKRVEKICLSRGRGQPLSTESASCLLASRAPDAGTAERWSSELKQSFEAFFDGQIDSCTAVVIDGDMVCLEEGDTTGRAYAVAVDLGVNTIAASLIDMMAGIRIAEAIDTNPQIDMGAEIDSRLTMVDDDPMNLEILSEELLLRIDILISELCAARSASPLHIYDIVVSGSTAMLHLFLQGVPGLFRQQAAFSLRGGVPARSLDLKLSDRARVYSLPVISSCVGADVTAGIIATRLNRCVDNAAFIDIGTFLKAVVYFDGRLTAAGRSGGAAFEGAGITFGMRPETGAVDYVSLSSGLAVSVVGESLVRGICGSGLISLAAALKRKGIIDDRGRFAVGGAEPARAGEGHMVDLGGQQAFRIYSDQGDFDTDIYVSQSDMDRLLEAKACLVSLIRELLERTGASFADMRQVFIGGAFGDRIDAAMLFELGILPPALENRVHFYGNTAKRGSQMVLLDKNICDEAENIVHAINSVSVSDGPPADDELHFYPFPA